MQPWCTPFPIWNQSVVPCPVLTIASWPAHRVLKRQVKWFGIPISLRIFQFVVIHTVKGFSIVNKAEIDIFLELFIFLMIQWMLAIWSLVPLPFLSPAWTSGNSWFTYCWSLAWRILSITLLTWGMSATVWSFEHSLILPFFGRASLVAQLLKTLPAMQETWVQSLGWEDPLEKGKATHSSTLAWRIPWTV